MKASPQRRQAHSDRFGWLPRLLHWSLAVAVLAAYALAFIAHLPAARRPIVVGWHNAAGVLAWSLTVCLLLWRSYGDVPRPLAVHFAWQVAARRLVTAVTYVLLVLVPVTGYLQASVEGPWVRFFHANFLPGLSLSDGARLALWQSRLHGGLALALFGAIGVHLGITLYHHFVMRDRTLTRMLP
jgi:superoxide oxidase